MIDRDTFTAAIGAALQGGPAKKFYYERGGEVRTGDEVPKGKRPVVSLVEKKWTAIPGPSRGIPGKMEWSGWCTVSEIPRGIDAGDIVSLPEPLGLSVIVSIHHLPSERIDIEIRGIQDGQKGET